MLVEPSVALIAWWLGAGVIVMLVGVPILVVAVFLVVANRIGPQLPGQAALGDRLAGLPSTLNAAVQSIGGGGLREAGLRSTAIIHRAVDTTSQVNRQPVIELMLEVDRPDGSTVMVQNRSVVPHTALHRLSPGVRIIVYHDPVDLQRLLVAWDELPPPAGPPAPGPGR